MYIKTFYEKSLSDLREETGKIIEQEIKTLKAGKRKRIIRFIKYFKILNYFGKESSFILQCVYFWARAVDDIIDGDRDHIFSFALNFFIDRKKKLLEEMIKNPLTSDLILYDEPDIMLFYAHRAAKNLLNLDILPFIVAIFETMEYDFLRSKEKTFLKQADLDNYFAKLDVKTVEATLLLMEEKNITAEDLQGLNNAVRIYYTLRDLPDDIKNNILNISAEEALKYKISLGFFCNIKSIDEALNDWFIGKWIFDQMIAMQKNLGTTNKILRDKKMKLKTKLALFFGFKLPCYIALTKWTFKMTW